MNAKLKTLGRIAIGVIGSAALLYVVVLVLFLVGIIDPEPAPVPAVDASAVIACRDFARFEPDATGGFLTPSEIQAQIKYIRNTSRLATDANIRASGDELLRTVTAGDSDAMAAAFVAFRTACLGQPQG